MHEENLLLPNLGLLGNAAMIMLDATDAVIYNDVDMSHFKFYVSLCVANLQSTKTLFRWLRSIAIKNMSISLREHCVCGKYRRNSSSK